MGNTSTPWLTQRFDLPPAIRIERIRRARWIGYTRAKQLLDKLEELAHPTPRSIACPTS